MVKKSNKFYNTSWNGGDSEGSREEEEHVKNNVAFVARSTMEKITGNSVSRDVPTGVPTDVRDHDSDSRMVNNLQWKN